MKKRRLEIDKDEVRFFKHGVLKDTISLPELGQVTYEFYKSVEAGITETLSFERREGKPIKFRIERSFKVSPPVFTRFVEFTEAWCKEKVVAFSRKVESDVKGATNKELDEMYKRYITPPSGDLRKWKRKRCVLLATFLILLFGLYASISPIFFQITSVTQRSFLVGLCILGPVALCAVCVLIDTWLNKKPEPASDQGIKAYEMPQETSAGLSTKSRFTHAIVVILITAFVIAFMAPVWFVETRLTRVLFTIGFAEIIGVGPFLALIYVFVKPKTKSCETITNSVPKRSSYLSLIFLLMGLGFGLALFGLMLPI